MVRAAALGRDDAGHGGGVHRLGAAAPPVRRGSGAEPGPGQDLAGQVGVGFVDAEAVHEADDHAVSARYLLSFRNMQGVEVPLRVANRVGPRRARHHRYRQQAGHRCSNPPKGREASKRSA